MLPRKTTILADDLVLGSEGIAEPSLHTHFHHWPGRIFAAWACLSSGVPSDLVVHKVQACSGYSARRIPEKLA